MSAAGDGGSYNTFQPTHPHSEIEFMIARDKEMYVIGH
jgi:hypothetical protein